MSKLVLNVYMETMGMEVHKNFDITDFSSRDEMIKSMTKSFRLKTEEELIEKATITVVENTFAGEVINSYNLPKESAELFR